MASAALPRRIIKETQRFLTDTGEDGCLRGEAFFSFFFFAMPFRPCFPHPLFHSLSLNLFSISVPGIKAEPDEQNLRYFKVEIDGPANTPYEGE